MTSPHRFLANDRNAAAGATVSASSILPAEATAFPLPRVRQGTARAILTGGYIGADDTQIDIEIVSDAGTGLLSQPVFAGAGNGALTDLAATGVPSQTFTLLLASTGTATKPAAVDFYGVKLVAKPVGAAGNGISITVDTSAIVATATVYSFLEEAKAGDSEMKGPQWDFGGFALTADGELDGRTPRLRFGFDPQIYRQYKTLVDNDWQYVLDPPLVRDLPAETPVYALSGSYTVTVTAGATVEQYPGIVTLFDLLNALKTRSNLIEVQGVVVEDRTPGGMAAEDLPLRTDAYALPATYTGNAKFPGLGAVTVPAMASTEILTLTCVDDAVLGGEVWRVKGSVTGPLADCATDRPYGDPSSFGWTVPKVLPDQQGEEPSGNIYVKGVTFASRPDGAPAVELCVTPLVAGAKAKSKTIEAVYTKIPDLAGCDCAAAEAAGNLSATCLGVEIKGGAAMTIDPEYQARLQAFYAWLAARFGANTGIGNGRVYGARDEAALADKIESLFLSTLDQLFISTPVPAALTAWSEKFAAMKDDLNSIAGQTSIDPDGWPTGAKLWKNGTVLNVGDYVKTDRQDVEPVFWKVTETILWGVQGPDPLCSFPRTFGVPVTIQDPPCAQSIVPDYGALWPEAITDNYITVGYDGDLHYEVQLKVIPPTAQLSATQADIDAFARRYESAMKEVLAIAGIVPKAQAGGKRSDCWQPCDGAFEWRLNGMEYLPACTNAPYHSSVKKHDCDGNEAIVSTQEFGFIIRCACPERLLEGDSITIVIDTDAAPPKTYAVGDTIKIPVIAAAPLELAGGQDGDDTLTWTVRGSLGADWPDYVAPLGAEPLYDHGGLQFRLKPGGVPFALGDQYRFDAAGGVWRWRRDGGAWSGDLPITVDPVLLADGLSVTFKPGPSPAFVVGDSWGYHVQQPHAPKLARSPGRGGWRWSGTSGEWLATFPADTTMTTVSVWHTCQSGATFSLAGLDDANTVLWAKPITYRKGLTVLVLEGMEAVAACRQLRLTVANAGGGSIKWVWCGVPWSPECDAASISLRETWQMSRGARVARLTGRGGAGEINWRVQDSAWLESGDWAGLLSMLEHVKAHNDEPLVFLPNAEIPEDARLVRIASDDIDISDWRDFQFPERALDVQLPLAMVPL